MFTLIGSLLGLFGRIVPELITMWNKKKDNEHELVMFDKQIEADKLKNEQTIALTNAQGQVSMDVAGIQALTESIKTQGQMTGVKWVDALNSLVRPVLTFWWVIILQTGIMWAQFSTLTLSGVTATAALIQIWGPEEKALVAGIINFWFLDRVIRKQQGI